VCRRTIERDDEPGVMGDAARDGGARVSTHEERFHEEWLGMVQPIDGLVVSIPVLVEAQCLERQPPERQRALASACMITASGAPAIADVGGFFADVLGWQPSWLRADEALPAALSLYVPEGQQVVKPTAALVPPHAGDAPMLLVWDLGREATGLALDRPEVVTGPWEYPVAAKFDRLLRHCRVPIGVLTNRTEVRLMYAPHGESSGSITFRVADMLEVGGRPILDALVMLLGAARVAGVAVERQLPAILAESRKRQANVTNELAEQVFDALQVLLRGFEAAAERDGRAVLDAAYERGDDHLYGGLLTHLLRLVFVLYAEDRGLLPVDHPLYAEHLSVLGLFERLQDDHGAHPDSMARRFGAYGRLTALFRAVYLGVQHDDLTMPARRGTLFSPQEYPFLEGWDGEPGAAPIVDPAARAAVRLPSVDDETVYQVLERLLVLRRQRLSYRALDVEQIGSVYEALMGYHVVRLEGDAVCVKPAKVWVTAEEVLAEKAATRGKWLQETTGMAKGQAEKVAKALAAVGGSGGSGAKARGEVLDVLEELAGVRGKAGTSRRAAGQLVVQPGPERRRTSSHYTPRSLTAPIVQKTLEPLFRAMGEAPPSERILNLKVCDPAMGSGAFLVEACRYLADAVVSAWVREGRHDLLSGTEDVTLVARRLVAQRCLYGVDKNGYAVGLAKLSMWLVTLAKDLPFTFVDHALRCGDSLVGLSFEQITAGHWKPAAQVELCEAELKATLGEAIAARERILELAGDVSAAAQKEKEWLLRDAEDALERVRMIGDVVVGAFFAEQKDKAREAERRRRMDVVMEWLRRGGEAEMAGEELRGWREEARRRIKPFHWMAEFPEVFWVRRRDPLDGDREGGDAWIDAFVGNPPFAGKNGIAEFGGPSMLDWLKTLHEGAHGNADYSAHFFRRADTLLGAHGTIGFIATSTISQGDTRATGLQALVRGGLTIYSAATRIPWDGGPNVAVAVAHLSKGPNLWCERRELDGATVPHISSQLRADAERDDPFPLATNADFCSPGSILLGMGFTLTEDERTRLVATNARNVERIFPYTSGEEINTSPTHEHHRYAIDFGSMSLEEAGAWPDLLEHVRATVKPERDKNKREQYRKQWWQFGEKRASLYATLSTMRRCLVSARITKHFALAWLAPSQVFGEVFVFLSEEDSTFATLQSRIFDCWLRSQTSTLEDRAATSRLIVTSQTVESFPFPLQTPRGRSSDLETPADVLYARRAAYMQNTAQGLTQTYNKLKDAGCQDEAIVALRNLHLDLDRAVLTAYGWDDLHPLVPPYTTPTTDAEKRALAAFEDAVIDRLFALNAHRAGTNDT
jgi:hypothetical protein